MNNIGFGPILTGMSLLSSIVMIALGTRLHCSRKRRNRRLGLPAPACARFPAWNADLPLSRFDVPTADAELPSVLRRQA